MLTGLRNGLVSLGMRQRRASPEGYATVSYSPTAAQDNNAQAKNFLSNAVYRTGHARFRSAPGHRLLYANRDGIIRVNYTGKIAPFCRSCLS